MPRFYFHLRNDMDVPDEEGKDLPDIETARSAARELVRFEVSEGIKRDGRLVLGHGIDIEDESGKVLDTVQFREVVAIEV